MQALSPRILNRLFLNNAAAERQMAPQEVGCQLTGVPLRLRIHWFAPLLRMLVNTQEIMATVFRTAAEAMQMCFLLLSLGSYDKVDETFHSRYRYNFS